VVDGVPAVEAAVRAVVL